MKVSPERKKNIENSAKLSQASKILLEVLSCVNSRNATPHDLATACAVETAYDQTLKAITRNEKARQQLD
jgi:hypothetical protein